MVKWLKLMQLNDLQYFRNSNKKVMGMFIDRRK